jgi:muconolactone delta-isomerase
MTMITITATIPEVMEADHLAAPHARAAEVQADAQRRGATTEGSNHPRIIQAAVRYTVIAVHAEEAENAASVMEKDIYKFNSYRK